jgi:hypothetical protein
VESAGESPSKATDSPGSQYPDKLKFNHEGRSVL